MINYEKLKEYGVEEHYIEDLKIIVQESDENLRKEQAQIWFADVSASIVNQSMYENIGKIFEEIRSLVK